MMFTNSERNGVVNIINLRQLSHVLTIHRAVAGELGHCQVVRVDDVREKPLARRAATQAT